MFYVCFFFYLNATLFDIRIATFYFHFPDLFLSIPFWNVFFLVYLLYVAM